MIVHAGLVALHHADGWRGALIGGPSGAGKSDLALRALDLGFRLVADDQTLVWTSAGRLYGACPAPIAGLMEVRGLGVIAAQDLRRLTAIDLIVDCVAPDAPVERLPEPQTRALLGVALPVLRLRAVEASAPAKLRCALSRLGA